MQILFDFQLLPSEKEYSFHDDSLQSYVYGLLDMLREFHSGLLSADGTILQIKPTGDISLIVPSCLTHVIIRRDIYRFLSFGLSLIQQSSLPFNLDKYPNLDDFQEVIIYNFSLTYVHPLFKKKYLSKFSEYLKRTFVLGLYRSISVDKDYFYTLFCPKFWQLSKYVDLYYHL